MRSRYDRCIGFLFSHPATSAGKMEDIFRLTTETAVKALRANRSEIWLLNGECLENKDTYTEKTFAHDTMPPLNLADTAPEDATGIGDDFSTVSAICCLGVPVGFLRIVGGNPVRMEEKLAFCDTLATIVDLALERGLFRNDRKGASGLPVFSTKPEGETPETGLRAAGLSLLRTSAGIRTGSRPSVGIPPPEERSYEVLPWIFGIVNPIHLRARERQIRFCVDVDPEVPRKLIGDPLLVRRVALHLLNNAVDFTTEGHVSLEIDGEHTNEGYRLRFRIADTGRGIPAERLPALFEPCFRVRMKEGNIFEGPGSELFACGNAVKRMSGEIHVKSGDGTGSEFRFSVGQQCRNQRPLIDIGSTSGKSILFMHESPIVPEHVKVACRRLGVQPCFCSTIEDFEREIRSGRFSCAVYCTDPENSPDRIEELRKFFEGGDYAACRFAVLADKIGDLPKRLPPDVPLLTEPFFSIPLACFLDDAWLRDDATESGTDVFDAAGDEASEVLCGELSGFLQVDRALLRLGKDTVLYRSLLEMFRESIPQSRNVLSGALRSSDRNALTLECHTLKSALETIGAEELAEEARFLEEGISDPERYAAFAASLGEFALKLDKVFRKTSGAPKEELGEKLSELRTALDLFDMQKSGILADEIISASDEQGAESMAAFKKYLDMLDYEAARRILDELTFGNT